MLYKQQKIEDINELEQLSFEEKRNLFASYLSIDIEDITLEDIEENEEFIELIQAAHEYGYFVGELSKKGLE